MDYKEKIIALLNDKELSQEQKEKLEYIFPELKELEDERIRQGLITSVSSILKGHVLYGTDISREEALTWLEKQGQVKESFISQHEIETCKENDDSLTSEDERMIRIIENAICTNEAQELVKTKYGLELTDLADWLEKQCEQKPTDEEMKELLRTEYEKGRADAIAETQVAWSEEDKRHVESILERLEGMCKKGATFIVTRFAVNQDIDWLKSFKPQPKQEWDEDDSYMLEQAIKCVNNSGKLEVSTEEIEEWLKALKNV